MSAPAPRPAARRPLPIFDKTKLGVDPVLWTPTHMRWRSTMGRPYPLEFRRQMVALVRSGRTADDLQREFRVSRESIRLWVAQAEQEGGDREALKPDERAELDRLRRE